MKQKKSKLFALFLLLLVLGNLVAASVLPVYSSEMSSNFTITIESPEDNQGNETVNVTITITDENNTGFQKAEVKLGENGKWQNITNLLKEQESGVYRIVAGIKNNGTIYVSVTDSEGNSHTENKTVHCFDDTPPTLHVSINRKKLSIVVENSSSIQAIYVGSHSFTEIEDNRLELDIQDYVSESQKTISIYAVDKAGNRSKTTIVDNPFYEYDKGDSGTTDNNGNTNNNSGNITHDTIDSGSTDNIEDTDSTMDSLFHTGDTVITVPPGNATKKTEESKTPITEEKQPTEQSPPSPENTTTQGKPTAPETNIETTLPQNQATPSPTQQVPNITINMPSMPTANNTSTPMVTQPTEKKQETQVVVPNGSITPTDGTGTVIENSVQTSATREFFTIQTEQGNIFYIVVDKQKQQNNVYLLSAVTEKDLLGLVGENKENSTLEKPKEDKTQELPEILLPPPTENQDATPPPPEENEKPEKNSPIATILFLIFFIGIAFGIAYYFKIYRPKQNAFDEDDEDEYWEESEEAWRKPEEAWKESEEETIAEDMQESENHALNSPQERPDTFDDTFLEDDIENGLTDADYYD